MLLWLRFWEMVGMEFSSKEPYGEGGYFDAQFL
jgi:hypothetical protein